MLFVVKINAPSDKNGNPRRGWYVFDKEGNLKGFLDEGFGGEWVIKSYANNRGVEYRVLASVGVTALEYRSASNDCLSLTP